MLAPRCLSDFTGSLAVGRGLYMHAVSALRDPVSETASLRASLGPPFSSAAGQVGRCLLSSELGFPAGPLPLMLLGWQDGPRWV